MFSIFILKNTFHFLIKNIFKKRQYRKQKLFLKIKEVKTKKNILKPNSNIIYTIFNYCFHLKWVNIPFNPFI